MKTQQAQRNESTIARAQLEHLYQLMQVDPDMMDDEHHILTRMREVCEERDQLQFKLTMAQRDIEKLMLFLEQLQHDTLAVEQSRAWRLGFRVVLLLKKLTGRAGARFGFSSIHRTFTLYHHWKKSRD